MKPTDLIKENAEDLNIGDPVIITGNVQFKGKTGDVVDFGKDKRFVIVNLYNHGKHSFQSSDVSYNDYAESGDEQEYLSQFEENKTGTIFVGQLKGTDPASKVRDRLVGEARSLQSKFEKHLAKHGYDVNEKQKYWEKKIKDIDAQIAAWDAEMERRKQGKEMTTESNKPKFQVGDHVKFLYMQKPEIWREGRVVGFGRGDMVNVQGERNEYSVHTNLLKKAKQGVTEDEYEDGNEEGFFVAIGSEEDGGFVGMVYKEGGKWREQEVAGNAPYNWGASYMGYLSPGDVMQWIRQDYGRHSRVKGPFDTEEAAFDFASRMYGLGESVSKGLPGSLSRSDYMPGAVRHDLSNINPKKTGPGWDSDRPVADVDPDWEKEQAAKRKKQGVAEGSKFVDDKGDPKPINQGHWADKPGQKKWSAFKNTKTGEKRLHKDDPAFKKDVSEGSGPQVGDAVYYGNRLVGWFKGYSKHGKIITEPNEEEMGNEYSSRDVYWDPQDKITIKPEQGVAEGRVPQLSPGGADYSKHTTDQLKAMLRPGVMHRDEQKFKTLIRRELKKREQGVAEDFDWREASAKSNLQPGVPVMIWLGPRNQNPPRDDKKWWERGVVMDSPEWIDGAWRVLVKTDTKSQWPINPERVFVLKKGVAEGEEWDEYTGGAPFPDTDDLDTYGGEHDLDDLDESSGTEYREFDIRASREYGTGQVVYWIYYRGRCTEHGSQTLDGAKKDIDYMIAGGFFNDPDEEARKKQRGVAEAFPNRNAGSTGTSKEDKRIAAALRKKHMPAKKKPAEQALNIGDSVIITGNSAFEGIPGRVIGFKEGKVVVDLAEHGKWRFVPERVKLYSLDNQGVAEGEYDPSYDPEYRGYSKPERNVDWDIEAKRNAPEEPKSTSTVTVRDNEGNVVLQFPSTGGYYGDLKYAANKGIDLEGGDYHANWQRNEDAMMSEASGVTSEQVASEIVRRIIFKHKDAISAFGPEAIMSAAREVGEFFAGSEELGTSDIGIATKYTLDKLEKMSQGALGESATGGATSAGAVATVPGGGKNVGSLFGGSYKQPKKKKK